MKIDEMIEELTITLGILRNAQSLVGSFTFSSPALPLMEAIVDLCLKLSTTLNTDFTVHENRNSQIAFSEEEQDSLGNPLQMSFRPYVRIHGPYPVLSIFCKDIASTLILIKRFLTHEFHDHGEFVKHFKPFTIKMTQMSQDCRKLINEINQKLEARRKRNQSNATRRTRNRRR